MITNNLKKSYNGVNKTSDATKCPLAVSGITEDTLPAPNNAKNIWRTNSTVWQHCCLDNSTVSIPSYSGLSVGYGYRPTTLSGDGSWFVDIGFGNTAEAATDYKLANSNAEMGTPSLAHKYGTNYSGRNYNTDSTAAQRIFPDDDPDTIVRVESVYENQTNEDIVVKEMGLMWRPGPRSNYNASVGSWTYNHFLIARKVLATPVTIHPGETYKFIYRLKA